MLFRSKFDFVSFTGEREEVKFESTPNDPPYARVTFWLHMRRNHQFGIMNFIMPCVVVTIMSLLVFLLPPDAGEKIGLSITVLLMLVVFLQTLGEATPATSDSTQPPVIATFFMLTMFIVTGSLVTTILVLNMHYKDVNLENYHMSKLFRYVFLKILPQILRMRPLDLPDINNLQFSDFLFYKIYITN